MGCCGCRGRGGAAGCQCAVEAGANVNVTGTGTPDDPWVVASSGEVSDTLVQIQDTATLNLSISGDGSVGNPYIISGVVVDPGRLTVQDTASLNLTLTGSGTTADPYVISGVVDPTNVQVQDTASLDLTISGAGTDADPYIISGVVDGGTALELATDPADGYAVGPIEEALSGTGAAADPFVVTSREAALRHNVAYSIPKWGSSTPDRLGASDPSVTAPATATAASYATTSKWTRSRRNDYVAASAAGAVTGARWTGAQVIRGSSAGEGGFYLKQVASPVSAGTSGTSHRFFFGLTGSSGAPSDVDPSTQTDIIGMGYDDDDTNVQIMHNDGSGSATKVDLGASFPVPTADNTALYSLELWCPGGGSDVFYRAVNVITGAVATGTLSSNLPSATTVLIIRGYLSTGGATAAATFGSHGWIESTPEVLA